MGSLQVVTLTARRVSGFAPLDKTRLPLRFGAVPWATVVLVGVVTNPSISGAKMKKTMMMAALLVMVGCGPKKEAAPAADTAAMAPAATDTGMGGMSHDSMPMSSDSTMARDTAKK